MSARSCGRERGLRLTRRAACVGSAALAFGACREAVAAPQAAGETVRWPALELPGGARLGPADWRDTAAVVVLWETTCPFCRRHNAHVEKLHRAAAGKRLRVITAARDRDPAAVRQYLAETGYTFAVTLQEALLLELFTSRKVIPMTCTIGRDGRLREVIPGEMFEEDLLAMLALAG